MKRTPKQVRQAIANIIKKSPHYPTSTVASRVINKLDDELSQFVEDGFMGFHLSFGNEDAIWADKCSLSINSKCEPSISWSSTSRSPAMARVALKNYAAACDIADQVQAVLDCTTIVDEKP